MNKDLAVSLLAAILIVGASSGFLFWAAHRPSAAGGANAEAAKFEAGSFDSEALGLAPRATAHALTTEDFTLSQLVRCNEKHGVELLRIGPDGTTYIRAMSTNNTLSAKPQECFSSAEFGRSGLYLDDAFPSMQTAKFVRTECETIHLP